MENVDKKRYKKRDINKNFKIVIDKQERIKCLEYIIKQNFKIIYVYEKSQDTNSGYDYKTYIRGLSLFISSSDDLFEGGLVKLLVNLHTILSNDFDKAKIKKIVYENDNFAKYLLKNEVGD